MLVFDYVGNLVYREIVVKKYYLIDKYLKLLRVGYEEFVDDFHGNWNKKENSNHLYWKTASELNTDFFEIKSSINGILFESVKKLKQKAVPILKSSMN